jgi:hypothetical protein
MSNADGLSRLRVLESAAKRACRSEALNHRSSTNWSYLRSSLRGELDPIMGAPLNRFLNLTGPAEFGGGARG